MFELKIIAKTPAELMAALADYMRIAEERGHSVTTGPAADVASDFKVVVEGAAPVALVTLTAEDANKVTAPVIAAAAAAVVSPAAAADSATTSTAADFAAQGEEPADDALVDKAGTPWDSRIHTSNKGKKKDETWKRKPGLTDESYNGILAEITPAVVAVAPAEVTPAVATPACDLNAVTAAATTLVTAATQTDAIGGAIGAAMLGHILTAYGAVGASPDGTTPGVPQIGALDLAYYPAFVQTCGALVTNLASCTAENYVSMIDTLLVRA